jgi:hypothetical protein
MVKSGIAQWECQAYIYNVMNQDSTLQNICPGGIHDVQPPPDVAYPYIVIGDWTETNDDMQAQAGRQVTSTLHVWDNYEGSKIVKAIGDRIIELIDRVPFFTDRWFANVVYIEYINNMLNTTDMKQHLIVRFRYKLTRRG